MEFTTSIQTTVEAVMCNLVVLVIAKVSERGGSRAMMSYKGYQAVLKYDDEAEIFQKRLSAPLI